MTEPFAKAGEVVTTQSGREVCTLARDLSIGDSPSVDCFTDWREGFPAPNTGDVMPLNDEDPWVRGNGGLAFQINIGREWRPVDKSDQTAVLPK
jgi:hypothetical protein